MATDVPADEKAFFASVKSQIEQAWFLHGDPLVIMIGSRPYLVSPSKDSAVKEPAKLAEELGQKIEDPSAVAQAAKTKNMASMLLWVSDVQSLVSLAKDFSANQIMSLQAQAKLRGFYNGQEHNKETVMKMDHSDLLKLGWSTLWLRGGMGREGVLKLASQASSASSLLSGSASLLDQSSSTEAEVSLEAEGSAHLSATARADRDWFRSMMRSTPSDGLNRELAAQAKELLLAFASDK